MNKKFISMCKGIAFILAVIILSFLVGYLISRAWTEPAASPPEGNVAAPINVGPEAQVKEGAPGTIAAGGFLGQVPGYGLYPDPGAASTIGSSLTITGSYLKLPLRTTAQRNALSPETGMMIYNTTANEVQVYIPSEWKKFGAGAAVGTTCTVPGECETGLCVDGYCCDAICTGNCNRCNAAGSLGFCTNVDSDCTGNCDVCSAGNCAANDASCTGNCDVCSGSGTAYNCAASAGLCSGNCPQCTGSGTAYSCSGNSATCTGNCDVCSGSGTAYNCAASNALCSNTASSCYCSGSGTSYNCQSCPDSYGACGDPTCSSYTCGNVATNEGTDCGTCRKCASGSCSGTGYPAGTTDSTAPGTCTAARYRCNGAGSCTNPQYYVYTSCENRTSCTGDYCSETMCNALCPYGTNQPGTCEDWRKDALTTCLCGASPCTYWYNHNGCGLGWGSSTGVRVRCVCWTYP